MRVTTVKEPILSPCMGVCVLDKHDVCIGCMRSADEIARWGTMSADERQRIMAALDSRGQGGDA